jgi:ribulose-5-phosphate 4-epimerase/fuculose-1-phosphate aldolase
MGDRNVGLRRGHGVAVVGRDIADAVINLIGLYELASVNWLAYSVGQPVAIDEADCQTWTSRLDLIGPNARSTSLRKHSAQCHCVISVWSSVSAGGHGGAHTGPGAI